MITTIIGIALIIIGTVFVNIAITKFKEELKMVDELSVFKRAFIHIATFIGLLNFDNRLVIRIRDIVYILWRRFYSINLLLT